MIKITNVDVFGWESAIRGMRNPMNSWDKSDSFWCLSSGGCTKLTMFCDAGGYCVGENDLKLMKNLSKAGSDHGKFLRMINVTCDINAPLYWWKEFDTYKVGTVANSCSTMHKIHSRPITIMDFSHEYLESEVKDVLLCVVQSLNALREYYNDFGNKCDWYQMIQLLPTSYNQKRTVQLNYQVLKSMYHARKHHKLDEWREFCKWCETLPYFKEICIQE